MYLQLKRYVQIGIRDKQKPISPKLGYDLNIAVNIIKLVANNTGSFLNLIDKGTKYKNVTFIWKAEMKRARKCSNISVKKYQNRPMLGCKSGISNLE